MASPTSPPYSIAFSGAASEYSDFQSTAMHRGKALLFFIAGWLYPFDIGLTLLFASAGVTNQFKETSSVKGTLPSQPSTIMTALTSETFCGSLHSGPHIFLPFLCPPVIPESLAENRPQSAELCQIPRILANKGCQRLGLLSILLSVR